MAIAAWYAQAMATDGRLHRQPLVAPEVVASVGDIVLVQMRQMGYHRFPPFVRYDSKKIQPAKSNKVGWFTYSWSRPILISSFINTIEQGWYELNSPWTLHECEHFESHHTAAGKVKQEHEEGEHDDGIFAAAISLQVVRGLQTMTDRSKKRFMGDAANSHLPPLDLGATTGQRFPSRDLDGYKAVTLEEL